MIKFDEDDGTEKYLRLMSKLFVSSIRKLPDEEAEQLAYESLKLTYIAKEVMKKMEKNKKGGR